MTRLDAPLVWMARSNVARPDVTDARTDTRSPNARLRCPCGRHTRKLSSKSPRRQCVLAGTSGEPLHREGSGSCWEVRTNAPRSSGAVRGVERNLGHCGIDCKGDRGHELMVHAQTQALRYACDIRCAHGWAVKRQCWSTHSMQIHT